MCIQPLPIKHVTVHTEDLSLVGSHLQLSTIGLVRGRLKRAPFVSTKVLGQ